MKQSKSVGSAIVTPVLGRAVPDASWRLVLLGRQQVKGARKTSALQCSYVTSIAQGAELEPILVKLVEVFYTSKLVRVIKVQHP